MLRVVLDNEQRPSGIFISIEDFEMLKPGIKAHSLIGELMDELSTPETMRMDRQNHLTGNGLTLDECEILEQNNREEYYIQCFASGNPAYYRDERCPKPSHFICAATDGSESLVQHDWKSKTVSTIAQLATSGKGKYAYLLHDARYIKLKQTNTKD
jgi:hypothetical protein